MPLFVPTHKFPLLSLCIKYITPEDRPSSTVIGLKSRPSYLTTHLSVPNQIFPELSSVILPMYELQNPFDLA